MIIDAHQHFWEYSPQRHAWINQGMTVIKKDFLPEDLKTVYQAHNVTGCVAVQADQSEGETSFLLQLASQHDFIKGVVGWVDLRAVDLDSKLDHFSQFEKLKGFRHIVQDESDPNFLLTPTFQGGLGQLEKRKFTYDLLIYPHQFPAAIQTVKNFPNLPFVLDHIAKPKIRDQEINDWAEKISTIAQEPNVYCKVSGMVTEANWRSWGREDFKPYLDVVFESFGIDRVMFGSDWPVCLLAGSFSSVLEIVRNYADGFSTDDREKLFYGNAKRFYRL